jgi:hypothetical protein
MDDADVTSSRETPRDIGSHSAEAHYTKLHRNASYGLQTRTPI